MADHAGLAQRLDVMTQRGVGDPAVEFARAALSRQERGDDGEAHRIAQSRQDAGEADLVHIRVRVLFHTKVHLYSMFDEHRTLIHVPPLIELPSIWRYHAQIARPDK